MGLKTALKSIGRKTSKGILMTAMLASTAMPTYSAMPAHEPNDPQKAEAAQKIQVDGITETYNLQSLNMSFNAGNINMKFRAVSKLDATREDGKKYASASGDKTVMDLEIVDDAFGSFGAQKADMRGEIIELVYTNPGFSNRANVKMKFNINKRTTPKMPLYATNPAEGSDLGPQIVDVLIIEGKDVPVNINGDRMGNNQHIADAMKKEMAPTKAEPNVGSHSLRINWPTDRNGRILPIYRDVYPETTQLGSLKETITPR